MKSTYFIWILSGWLLAFSAEKICAQDYLRKIDPETFNGNFLELAREINMYYDTAAVSRRGGYKQWKRSEWFAKHHLDANGELAPFQQLNSDAVENLKLTYASQQRTVANGDWFNIGAQVGGNMALQGRINSIAFDPVNASIIYAATAGGGIWKTYNNGDNWVNLTIDNPILGFGDIAVAPAPNNNIVYALSGDANWGANVYVHNSVGVFKSYNGGITWERTGLIANLNSLLSGYRLLINPINPNTLIVAMEDAIHISWNAGQTWNVLDGTDNVNDIEFRPGDTTFLYYCVIKRDSVFTRNLNTGAVSICDLGTGLPRVDRMELAVSPDNPMGVYALCGRGYMSGSNNLFMGLYYSFNGGSSFSMRANSCADNGDLFNSGGSISWYANTMFVDQTEELTVIVGGLNLFKSTDGGFTLIQVTNNSIHADYHVIKRNPLNGQWWLGNDGGIYRSTDNGNTWENKSNGLIINEFYRISGTNDTNDNILGGTQDNGHLFRITNGGFQFVMGNDGMDNLINSFDKSIAYACSQNGGLNRSITFGTSFYLTALPNAGDEDFFPWISPIVQHPPSFDPGLNQWINTDVIYIYSFAGIWRCTNGAIFTLMPGLVPGPNAGPSPSLAVGSDANGVTLYVSNGVNVWSTTNPLDANPSWGTAFMPNLNGGFVSAMAVNPANRNEIWIAVSGYSAGTKVFRSFSSGFAWDNMSGTLPNVPTYSICFANAFSWPPGSVYIGTEIGIFYKDDWNPDWQPFYNGLPHVPVTDLELNYQTAYLKAATYGRGIWESDLYEPCPSIVLVDDEIFQGQYHYESSNLLYAYHHILGGVGTRVTMKAASQIRWLNGFKAEAGTYVRAVIGNCGTGPVNLSSFSEDDPKTMEPKIAAEKSE